MVLRGIFPQSLHFKPTLDFTLLGLCSDGDDDDDCQNNVDQNVIYNILAHISEIVLFTFSVAFYYPKLIKRK